MTATIVRHDIRTASGTHRIEQRVDLDEMLIPGVLHVEDMGDGNWHVSLSGGSLIVFVSRRGVTIVEENEGVRR
jgi:hypothetical protein